MRASLASKLAGKSLVGFRVDTSDRTTEPMIGPGSKPKIGLIKESVSKVGLIKATVSRTSSVKLGIAKV